MKAARAPAPQLTVLSTVAASLGVTVGDLQDSLFADLPGERLVGARGQPVSAVQLALRSNLARNVPSRPPHHAQPDHLVRCDAGP